MISLVLFTLTSRSCKTMDVNAILADLGYEDWEGDMDVLVCPHGYTIELDGRCPNGCVSPFITAGLL
jgi:hypothetical protein